MQIIIKWNTDIGIFYIAQSDDGYFHPIFENESLGYYSSIYRAVDDLVHGATLSILHPTTQDLVDTSTLGFPEDPVDWEHP